LLYQAISIFAKVSSSLFNSLQTKRLYCEDNNNIIQTITSFVYNKQTLQNYWLKKINNKWEINYVSKIMTHAVPKKLIKINSDNLALRN